MAYTYDQLNMMTVGELRKIADGIDQEAVHGHATMHKEKLVPALCTALGIESHVHHQAKIGDYRCRGHAPCPVKIAVPSVRV